VIILYAADNWEKLDEMHDANETRRRKAKLGEIDKNEQTEHTMNKAIITWFAP